MVDDKDELIRQIQLAIRRDLYAPINIRMSDASWLTISVEELTNSTTLIKAVNGDDAIYREMRWIPEFELDRKPAIFAQVLTVISELRERQFGFAAKTTPNTTQIPEGYGTW